jgi:hypothetical protein
MKRLSVFQTLAGGGAGVPGIKLFDLLAKFEGDVDKIANYVSIHLKEKIFF